ncbi:Glutamine transport ATP-binding protein GlnQ [Serratia rubidaea]|uniref:Glutamine transport ATP-binding protein GlnQ n=1 Tax=Serratia rubidaea TaxID=61652 RepID=A0A447QRJ5_SERRU|nr:Glutamine transport ATP-binding protein GlnQ [Serratia rubidaea]
MIEFNNVSKHFGQTQVLHDIDLKINQGEVVVIIGPSGSGKSTLLRCINKLEEITRGDLIVDGLKVNDPNVDEQLIRQEAGMVFQQFYLFPHLTALENVAFGPIRVRGLSKTDATGWRASCWRKWDWRSARITTRPSCPAASSSAWPSPARWR